MSIFIYAQKKVEHQKDVHINSSIIKCYLTQYLEGRMTVVYPVILTCLGDKEDTYLVDIPDIDGTTEGYGLSDAIEMARDYIGCTLYDKDDSTFPKASRLESIDVQKGRFAKAGESVVLIVKIDITAYRRMNRRNA